MNFHKFIFYVFLAMLSAGGNAHARVSPKILIVLNQGYRPEEYIEPRKIFEASGFEIKIAGHYLDSIQPSKTHIGEVPPVYPDVLFDKVQVDDFDAVVFVGGNGAWNDFLPNPNVHKILIDSFRHHKITALICAATGLLATADNLNGDSPQFRGAHVTGYFEVAGILKTLGKVSFDSGKKEEPYVVIDGNLITGRDPMSARLFGQAIVDMLKRNIAH